MFWKTYRQTVRKYNALHIRGFKNMFIYSFIFVMIAQLKSTCSVPTDQGTSLPTEGLRMFVKSKRWINWRASRLMSTFGSKQRCILQNELSIHRLMIRLWCQIFCLIGVVHTNAVLIFITNLLLWFGMIEYIWDGMCSACLSKNKTPVPLDAEVI